MLLEAGVSGGLHSMRVEVVSLEAAVGYIAGLSRGYVPKGRPGVLVLADGFGLQWAEQDGVREAVTYTSDDPEEVRRILEAFGFVPGFIQSVLDNAHIQTDPGCPC